jgi:Flp pilus assembly protein protease CpaA
VLTTQEIEVTKLVPLLRFVLQRFPLVCVRIRSDLRGLIVSNRVTLTLPCASAIARSMLDRVAKLVLVMVECVERFV